MSWSYDISANPLLASVRLLIMDTNQDQPIFQDEEINLFLYLRSSQGIYQSGQANPTGNSIAAAVITYSVYGAAALGLMSMAANKSYLSSISRILDVEIDPSRASKALKAMADGYLAIEDNSGAFAIAETQNTIWDAEERVVKQFLREYGG